MLGSYVLQRGVLDIQAVGQAITGVGQTTMPGTPMGVVATAGVAALKRSGYVTAFVGSVVTLLRGNRSD